MSSEPKPALSFAAKNFPAMRHRNFRLFFIGQGLSLLGTWMQMATLAWFVWDLTRRESALGDVWFAAQIPNLILAPLAGVLADRHDRRRMIIVTQLVAMLQAFALAGLTISGVITFGMVIPLALWLGIANAFDMPTRQSFVVEMIDRKDLGNAIALNSFIFNIARIIAFPIAGLLYEPLGPGPIFLVNAFSFLLILGALVEIKVNPRPHEPDPEPVMKKLRAGFRFAAEHQVLRYPLLFIGVISFMGLPYQILMPAIADKVLGHQASGYGLLMASIGAGSLLGAIVMMRGVMGERLELLIPLSGVGFGLGLFAFSFSHSFALSMVILFPTGASMMMQTLGTNTMLQKFSPDAIRGRVMSFYTMMLLGLYPLGSKLMGRLAEEIGALETVRLGGATVLAGGLALLALSAAVRRSADRLQAANDAATTPAAGPPAPAGADTVAGR